MIHLYQKDTLTIELSADQYTICEISEEQTTAAQFIIKSYELSENNFYINKLLDRLCENPNF